MCVAVVTAGIIIILCQLNVFVFVHSKGAKGKIASSKDVLSLV